MNVSVSGRIYMLKVESRGHRTDETQLMGCRSHHHRTNNEYNHIDLQRPFPTETLSD